MVLPGACLDFGGKGAEFRLSCLGPLAHLRIMRAREACLDCIPDASLRAFGLGLSGPKVGQPKTTLGRGCLGPVEQAVQQILKPGGTAKLGLERTDHGAVTFAEAEVPERAGACGHRPLRLAGDVAVAPALSGQERKPCAAAGLSASADLGEKRRTAGPARRQHARPLGGKPGPGGIEERPGDDGRAGDGDPFLARANGARPAVAHVVEMLTDARGPCTWSVGACR